MAVDGSQGGVPMRRKAMLALTAMAIWECLYYGILVGCVSLMCELLTHNKHHMMRDTDNNIVSEQAVQKRQIS